MNKKHAGGATARNDAIAGDTRGSAAAAALITPAREKLIVCHTDIGSYCTIDDVIL